MPPARIQWPDDLDERRFLAEYWQRKPLLIRQAIPAFQTPLPADELAGLSLEPDTTPRLILRDEQGHYTLEHGPFDADRFSTLTGNDWSLLVTDVEKHLPELNAWLHPFRFLPDWRIDDLMVSYAPVGASVGAHTDEYDVFLLQASGAREWSIDTRSPADPRLQSNATLRLLADFNASDTWTLQAGDMLYLPPGVPHHGIACEEPCTTWSIGFRAPSQADLAMRISEMICESLPHERYRDELREPARPGEIDPHSLQRLIGFWQQAMNRETANIASLLGRFLTESAGGDPATDPDAAFAGGELAEQPECGVWQRAPFSRIAWIADDHRPSEDASSTVQLFVDGQAFRCQQGLAVRLCSPDQPIDLAETSFTCEERDLLLTLIDIGALQRAS